MNDLEKNLQKEKMKKVKKERKGIEKEEKNEN